MAALGTGMGQFLAALETRSRVAAVEVVTSERAAGATVWQIVDELIRPALVEVGCRWERDEWSVAHEHAATVVADFALSSVSVEPHLGFDPRDRSQPRGRLVAACPAGEWHALAVRTVGEALRERGWDVTFLGASVPARELNRFLADHRPDALLLGVTMAGHMSAALEGAAAAAAADVPTVVGGAAFPLRARTGAAIGAYSAPSAGIDGLEDAVRQAIAAGPLAAAASGVSRERCADISRARLRILDGILGGGRARRGAAAQQDFVRDCAVPLVDAVAASALVDDVRPLADLVTWFRAAAVHRGLASADVDGVLRALEDAVGALTPDAATTIALATGRPAHLEQLARETT